MEYRQLQLPQNNGEQSLLANEDHDDSKKDLEDTYWPYRYEDMVIIDDESEEYKVGEPARETEEELLNYYSERIDQDNRTYADITLSEEVYHAVLLELYGRKGYFVQEKHANAGERGSPRVDKAWADNSHRKAQEIIAKIRSILEGTLEEYDIPNEARAATVDKIVRSIQIYHSGSENRKYHEAELKEARSSRRAMGQSALRGFAAD